MKIKIFAVGGTIDKVYFDRKSDYQVGEPTIEQILRDASVSFEYECESVLKKDSLDMTDADRRLLYDRIAADPNRLVLVTHGTDTMIQTAKTLQGLRGKVIVLTGAIEPARSKTSDAPFNVGSAVTAVQLLPEGVYIALHGRIFDPGRVTKNRERNRFEET